MAGRTRPGTTRKVFSPVANQILMTDCLVHHSPQEFCLGCGPFGPLVANKPRGITPESLGKMFIIFVESMGGIFYVSIPRRKQLLGFPLYSRLKSAFTALEKAGWIVNEKERGQKRWDLDKVAPEWISALKKHIQATKPPPEGGDIVRWVFCQAIGQVNPAALQGTEKLSVDEILSRLSDKDFGKVVDIIELLRRRERRRRRALREVSS